MDSELSMVLLGIRGAGMQRRSDGSFVARLHTKRNSGLGIVTGYGPTPGAALAAAYEALEAKAKGKA